MILTLNLDKVERGLYRATITDHGVEVTDPTEHDSLAQALQASALAIPADFARFVEPRYSGCTTGTISCEELARASEDVAARLVEIVAQVHHAER